MLLPPRVTLLSGVAHFGGFVGSPRLWVVTERNLWGRAVGGKPKYLIRGHGLRGLGGAVSRVNQLPGLGFR